LLLRICGGIIDNDPPVRSNMASLNGDCLCPGSFRILRVYSSNTSVDIYVTRTIKQSKIVSVRTLELTALSTLSILLTFLSVLANFLFPFGRIAIAFAVSAMNPPLVALLTRRTKVYTNFFNWLE
ncbi:hypothetical protein PMAYCL1PPCAC_20291, partial [Pristionchus mayeri]